MKDSVPDRMAALNSPSLEERREMRDAVSGVAATLDTLRKRLFAWLDKHPLLSGVAILVLVALGYNFSLYLLYGALPSSNGWAIYWPYDGVTIALLLMSSRRRWPWILGGFLVTSIYAEMYGKNLNVGALVDISGNLIEVLLAAYLLPPFHSLKEWMMEPSLARRFTLYAILLGPAITSFPAAWYYGHVRGNGFWNIFVKWGFTDALGTALWLPLILVLTLCSASRPCRRPLRCLSDSLPSRGSPSARGAIRSPSSPTRCCCSSRCGWDSVERSSAQTCSRSSPPT